MGMLYGSSVGGIEEEDWFWWFTFYLFIFFLWKSLDFGFRDHTVLLELGVVIEILIEIAKIMCFFFFVLMKGD